MLSQSYMDKLDS